MTATFIVCWTLLYGPTVGQKNCTPDLGYDQAQAVMANIVKFGNSYADLSMTAAPAAPAGPPVKLYATPTK